MISILSSGTHVEVCTQEGVITIIEIRYNFAMSQVQIQPPKGGSLADRLDDAGVLDQLAEAIVTLYTTPKPPPEIYNFFLQTMKVEPNTQVEKLLTENQELRRKIKTLKLQIAEYESRLKK